MTMTTLQHLNKFRNFFLNVLEYQNRSKFVRGPNLTYSLTHCSKCPFLDVFPLFLSKRRCFTQRIFSMKPYKSIFLSIGANLKTIEKKADL